MKIEIEDYKSNTKAIKRMLTAMIVSDEAANQLCSIYDREIMPDMKEVSKIIDWVCEYFDQYEKAPGNDMQAIFEIKSQSLDEDEMVEISKFLTVLNEDFVKLQLDDFTYVIHESKKMIQTEIRKYLAEELMEAEGSESVDEILEDLQRFSNDSVDDISETCNPFDEDVILQTLRKSDAFKPLLTLPGAIGQVINPTLIRSAFVSFQGEEKVGKTWWLMYLYMMALRKNKRVIFFQAGDMTEKDFNRRFVSIITRTSTFDHNCGQFDNVAYKNDRGKIHYHTETIKKAGMQQMKQMIKFANRNGKDSARVATYANGTLSASLIDTKLDQLYRQYGYVPDIIIADYMDIFAPEPRTGHQEGRHIINANWMAMRALSQRRKALVITATQGSKDSRDKLQSKKSGTEDKRKDSHITASFGLSSHSSFKESTGNGDCFQINQLYNRNGPTDGRLIFVQRELRKGQVCVGSKFVDYPGASK